MADFTNFESAGQDLEEDPAAEFLAREQNELAGLEDDFPVNDTQQNSLPDVEDLTNGSGSQLQNEIDFMNADTENVPETNGPSSMYAAISQVDEERAEPEKLKRWREEQKEMLEEKDAASDVKKEEWHEAAKKELDDWYKNRAEQLEKAKENNRAHEVAFIQERDESLPGHEWERICRHCDFNPKNSKNSKDVSRMRSALLQLKQTPLAR